MFIPGCHQNLVDNINWTRIPSFRMYKDPDDYQFKISQLFFFTKEMDDVLFF